MPGGRSGYGLPSEIANETWNAGMNYPHRRVATRKQTTRVHHYAEVAGSLSIISTVSMALSDSLSGPAGFTLQSVASNEPGTGHRVDARRRVACRNGVARRRHR